MWLRADIRDEDGGAGGTGPVARAGHAFIPMKNNNNNNSNNGDNSNNDNNNCSTNSDVSEFLVFGGLLEDGSYTNEAWLLKVDRA